jgi:drug/metabolite transporter (DMT)-like permease
VSAGVVAAVLFAALLHATWNALVKSGGSVLLSTALVSSGSALMAALALPFCTQPDPASWPYIAMSSLVQVAYYFLLVRTYRDGGVSFAYPLMRGTAPLLVAIASLPLLGERLHAAQWIAIASICGGILAMCLQEHQAGRGGRTTALFALSTACTIASYTMIDGRGVRISGAPLAYALWIFLLTGAGFVALAQRGQARALVTLARERPRVLLLGGAGSLGSYGIALWAMTQAHVAAVAALRETSILFATAIAALVLREKVGPARIAAVALVACGAVLMRLA